MDIREVNDLEISRLEPRYAHTRIERDHHGLAASIDRVGQLVPLVVTRSLVVLDGYLRLKALRSLGRDTVRAEIWDIAEEEAIGELLARNKGRPWETIEEAALLCELHDRYRLSQERIAAMAGRTQGWVSSRLALYRSLPEELIDLIRRGSISTWTAARVIVPIARAIPEHGTALSAHLSRVSLSTREMSRFFDHYRKANRRQRDLMVGDPALFVKSLHAKEAAADAQALKEGPEGTWCKDLRVVTHILARLARQVRLLFPCASTLERRLLLTAFEESRQQYAAIEDAIRRHDDYRRDETGDPRPSCKGCPPPEDQPDTQALPEHGEAGGQRRGTHPAAQPV